MAGFFKKFASAFVEFEPTTGQGAAPMEPDTSELELAALQAELGASRPQGPASEPPPAPEFRPTPAPTPSTSLPADTAAALALTPDQVFAEAGFTDGVATAPRLLKMLVGLASFPATQQLAMLRALDAADDAWSEAEVTEDAKRRAAVLEAHLSRVEQSRQGRLAALDNRSASLQAERVSSLAEVDRQIAEMMKLREDLIMECAAATSAIDREKSELEQAAAAARKRTEDAAGQLSQLVAFFATGAMPPR